MKWSWSEKCPLRGAVKLLFAVLVIADAGGCARERIERTEWPVMGTVAAIQVRGEGVKYLPGQREIAQTWFQWVVSEFNAFDPSSHLNRLAPLPDDEVLEAAHDPCYQAAFELMKASGGAFNPRWRGPRTLDFGAIAKGYAVDLAALNLAADVDALIDLGGNLKSLHGDWRTGVKDPLGEGVAAEVTLHAGEALATSATYYRGDHICDGRTNRPVTNAVASVTVLAKSAMWADGLSTTLFILGPDDGRVFMERSGRRLAGDGDCAVLWIMNDGRRIKIDPDGRFE